MVLQKVHWRKMKKQLLEKLKDFDQLNVPGDQYLIWGSGPMAVREMRPARDVDILVSQEYWERLAQKYSVHGENKNLIRIGVFEIWKDCRDLTGKIEQMLKDRDVIDGYSFMKLCYTIEWKKLWNRQKDRDDILMIETF